ncbi:MAG: PspC domain-containing protein [Acidobacteria bacterium]|nr:PspC domain-containing protein [Acidobacteriota bacterium]
MYCTNCGRDLREGDGFCSGCGRPTGPTAAGSGTPSGPAKRLVRPMKDKKIAGVCAGFARYLDLDVTLVRIVWLLVAVLAGTGLIAYLVAWIAMPKEYGPAGVAAA